MTDEAMQIWKEACKAGANAYYAAGEQPNDPEGVKQSAILHKAAAAVIAEALAAKDARIAEQAKEIERLASLALEQPCEPGSFAGDIWYGHPEKRTLGTHRWDGSAWQELPSEIEGCLSLLADARARIADLTAEVARKDEALRAALGELYAPEASCSCHISPPCGDCVEYSSIRSTQDLIRAALETKHD